MENSGFGDLAGNENIEIDSNIKRELDRLILDISTEVVNSSVSKSIKNSADLIGKCTPEIKKIMKDITNENANLSAASTTLKDRTIELAELDIPKLLTTIDNLERNLLIFNETLDTSNKILQENIDLKINEFLIEIQNNIQEHSNKMSGDFEENQQQITEHITKCGVILVVILFFSGIF